MDVYKIVTIGKNRRAVDTITLKATDENDALTKAKAKGVFTKGVRGFKITKTANVEEPELTLEFCAREIVKYNSIRVGQSILAWCYDGTVSVVDWNGHTKWFPQLSIEAIQYFIDVQPA